MGVVYKRKHYVITTILTEDMDQGLEGLLSPGEAVSTLKQSYSQNLSTFFLTLNLWCVKLDSRLFLDESGRDLHDDGLYSVGRAPTLRQELQL